MSKYDTSKSNQLLILLQALRTEPQSTISLRHDFGIMHPAGRVNDLRNIGYEIHTIRISAPTPDGVSHKLVAKYVLQGLAHG